MKIRMPGVSVLVLAACLVAPAAARAQTSAPASKGDIEGAVDLANWVRNRGVTVRYSGWHAGASYRIVRTISVLAEVGGDYRTESGTTLNIYAFAGGARFDLSPAASRVRPFAQVEMGTAMDNGRGTGVTNHYPVVSPAGGLDLGLSKHAAVRLRLDFPLYATFGDVYKGLRVSAGISVPIGGR